MRAAAVVGGLALVGVLVAAMLQVASAFGGVLVCGIGWAVVLVVLRSRLGAPQTVAPASRPPQPPPTESSPSFRKVEGRLWSADRSPRLYDHATRPLLSRVTAVVLRHRTGVDLVDDPERARAVLGDDAWGLVDPHHPPSDDNEPPGVRPERIARLLSRLEEL